MQDPHGQRSWRASNDPGDLEREPPTRAAYAGRWIRWWRPDQRPRDRCEVATPEIDLAEGVIVVSARLIVLRLRLIVFRARPIAGRPGRRVGGGTDRNEFVAGPQPVPRQPDDVGPLSLAFPISTCVAIPRLHGVCRTILDVGVLLGRYYIA